MKSEKNKQEKAMRVVAILLLPILCLIYVWSWLVETWKSIVGK